VWSEIHELPVGERVAFQLRSSGESKECQGDGHWLRHVFYNLIRNAVEAFTTQPNPAVEVHIDDGGEAIVVSVCDNGCGMSEEQLKKLFQPFFSTKGTQGTGLGLSVCQKVVELHGGRIECNSTQGQGTTFRVALPRAQVPTAAKSNTPESLSLDR